MFFWRTTLCSIFIIVAAVSSVSSTHADSCKDAYDDFNKQAIGTVKPFVNKMIAGMNPNDRFEIQKNSCEMSRQMLSDEQKSLELRRAVDRACGTRINWQKCDTACAMKAVKESEQKTAYDCDPARLTEIQAEIDAERKKLAADSANMERCASVTFATSSDVSKMDWESKLKGCNALPTDICNRAWLDLEEHSLPTRGLTCSPSREYRAEQKRIKDEFNSPNAVRERDNESACAELVYGITQDRRKSVEKCNSAKSCKMWVDQIKENKQSLEGLKCP